MYRYFVVLIVLAACCPASLAAQITTFVQTAASRPDSLPPAAAQGRRLPEKVLHAEPLFIDLIRDLGARKGEKEWNVGLGLTDADRFDRYTALIEYEFAPIDRLGLEVELPFSFYYPVEHDMPRDSFPRSRLNSLKMAAQYSFFVSEKWKTSLAIGYLHEIELPEFRQYGREDWVLGNVFNPFFIAAKRWGGHFHTLLYTGPVVTHHLNSGTFHTIWQINSNFHFMIPRTRNFIGVELNKAMERGDFDLTVRPQMRVGIADNLLVGIVTGIPISREEERFSSFIRLIYEPGHKHHR